MIDCAECGGLCCTSLQIPGVDEWTLQELEWAKLRGIVADGIWYVNAPCKHFVRGRCTIYETRPQACKDYPVGGPDCLATRKALRGKL